VNRLRSGRNLWFIILLAVVLPAGGCDVMTGGPSGGATSTGEGFAIYLTRDNVPVSQMEVLSHVAIAATPIIGPEDIIIYDWRSHNIALMQEAFERIEALRPATHGLSFVVCVDRQPVYWGAFWPMYSSLSFDGVVIPVSPMFSTYDHGIRIELGYPGAGFWNGRDDPRDAPDIKAALAAAGKLKQ